MNDGRTCSVCGTVGEQQHACRWGVKANCVAVCQSCRSNNWAIILTIGTPERQYDGGELVSSVYPVTPHIVNLRTKEEIGTLQGPVRLKQGDKCHLVHDDGSWYL